MSLARSPPAAWRDGAPSPRWRSPARWRRPPSGLAAARGRQPLPAPGGVGRHAALPRAGCGPRQRRRAASCATAAGSSSTSASTAAPRRRSRPLRAAGARGPARSAAATRRSRSPPRPPTSAPSATLPGSAGVTEVLAPIVRGADCGGAVVSEGDSQLNAAAARESFGVDGSGVTVGILSDSFDRDASAATHAARGRRQRRPAGSRQPLRLLRPRSASSTTPSRKAGTRGGRWPRSSTTWRRARRSTSPPRCPAKPPSRTTSERSRRLGRKVIVDDVAYLEEPFFQDGPVAVAVGEVAAAGVSYLSAAGNDNVISAGHDVAPPAKRRFRDAGSCPTGVPAPERHPLHGLRPWRRRRQRLRDRPSNPARRWSARPAVGGTVERRRDRPRRLPPRRRRQCARKPRRLRNVEQHPEAVRATRMARTKAPGRRTCRLAIPRFARRRAAPSSSSSSVGNGPADVCPDAHRVRRSPPAATSSARRSSATPAPPARSPSAPSATTTPPSPSPTPREARSSTYFGPVVGTSPAPPTAEQVIPKPDLAATDCGATTFFSRPEPSSPAPCRFCGTSAAAPHAAAVAALLRAGQPRRRRGPGARRAGRNRAPGRRLRARRGRRRADRRVRRGRSRSPCRR